MSLGIFDYLIAVTVRDDRDPSSYCGILVNNLNETFEVYS